MINFYIVATPIGNYEDITFRAVKILKEIDFIVCEEEKEYKKLFRALNIAEKDFILCNEHNEDKAVELVITDLKKGKKGALISDCGTPLFEDPGFVLLQAIREYGFQVTSLPGANSLITTLSLSPYKIKNFYFAGFLPREKEERKLKIIKLLKRNEPIVLIEAPYRLINIISLLKETAKNRQIYLSYNLTMEDEALFWGSPDKVEELLVKRKIKKGEFLVIIV